MFLDELVPLAQELTKQPLAFLGGFCTGVLRLNLADDPLRSWLDKQKGTSFNNNNSSPKNKPQSIDIE